MSAGSPQKFNAQPGECMVLAPGISRILAPNPSPFTYTGTCTYLLGEKDLTLVDPGPMSGAHLGAIGRALAGRKLRHILITHTHRDHSPLASEVKAKFGGETFGYGPHRLARDIGLGEVNAMEGSGDLDFVPDHFLRHDQALDLGEWGATVLFTPGHCANHLCFALQGGEWLISGDHVMGWSTSIVAPPEGSMRDYMAGLELLLSRPESRYLPGHGAVIEKAPDYVRGLINHRNMREKALLAKLESGPETIAALVEANYRGLDPSLKPAAALSVFAQLEWLVERNQVIAEGGLKLDSLYHMVD